MESPITNNNVLYRKYNVNIYNGIQINYYLRLFNIEYFIALLYGESTIKNFVDFKLRCHLVLYFCKVWGNFFV